MSSLTWMIGNVRITRIPERESSGKMTARMAVVDGTAITPEMIAPCREWLSPHFLNDDDEFTMVHQSFLIESMGKRIVLDTGAGEAPPGYLSGFKPVTDSLVYDFAKAGFPRESIDVVINTHLHADHVGWNTMKSDAEWTPTFPKARYIIARKDYECCLAQPGHMFYSNFSQAVKPIVDSGLADLIEGSHQVTDEIRLEPTPGHTPGHMSVWVESKGKRALIAGDATHHPVQWAKPDWAIRGESDSIMSTQTRRRLIEEYAKKPFLIIGGHYPTPCAGYLEGSGQGARFIPLLP